jgi:hypothetical protein
VPGLDGYDHDVAFILVHLVVSYPIADVAFARRWDEMDKAEWLNVVWNGCVIDVALRMSWSACQMLYIDPSTQTKWILPGW